MVKFTDKKTGKDVFLPNKPDIISIQPHEWGYTVLKIRDSVGRVFGSEDHISYYLLKESTNIVARAFGYYN